MIDWATDGSRQALEFGEIKQMADKASLFKYGFPCKTQAGRALMCTGTS